MNSNNKIQCKNRDNNGKTTASNNNIKNSKLKQNIFNYKNSSVPHKESDELDEVLEKLLIAYEYMTPAVEEIINTVSNFMPKVQTYEQDDPICSITTEQYDEVIKAVMLIKDATAKKTLGSNSILTRFSLDTFLNGIKCSIKVGSMTTSTFRVYLEKTVVNELVLLYKLLYDEIQDINYSSDGDSEITPSTHRRISSISQKLHHNIIENSEKLASLEAEYQALSDTINILKSVISETTTGSGYDIMSTTKSTTDPLKKIKASNSVSSLKTNQCITDASGARRCILECLYELTEVRKHLKNSNSKDDVEIKSTDASTISKMNCCDNQEVPHLHAKLNGIPIVLTLNKIQWQDNLKKRSKILNTYFPSKNKSNDSTQYKFINNVLVNKKKVKHRSIYTVTRIGQNDVSKLCHITNQKIKYCKSNLKTPAMFLNKQDIVIKLHFYIYLNNNIHEHAQKVYDVRFFEIEEDVPSKEKTAKDTRRTPSKENQIQKQLRSNTDELDCSSDTLEIRVFEFKRKNVSKNQEFLTQLRTNCQLKHLNNVYNKQKDSTVFPNDEETALVNVFAYTQKPPMDSIHKVEKNSQDVCTHQNILPVKTCDTDVNSTDGKQIPVPESQKILDQYSGLYNCNSLSPFSVHKNIYTPPWKIDQNDSNLQTQELHPYTNKVHNFEKKVMTSKSVQCNFLSTSFKNTLPIYIPTKTFNFLPLPPNSVNRTLSLSTRLAKTSKSRVSIKKNKHRTYLLQRRLSTINKTYEKYLKTLNKIKLRQHLKNVLDDESVYSFKINQNLRTQKCVPFKIKTFDTNLGFSGATKKTKHKSKPKTSKDTNYDYYYNAYLTDLQNFIINLMQTEASIVLKSLGFKVNETSHHNNFSVGTSFQNKTLETINTKNSDTVDLCFKEDSEHSCENSGTTVKSTYSNIQFVNGDITPTKNHKIFNPSRSISNINKIKIDESTRECNLDINIGKKLLVTKFDYTKYSLLVQPINGLQTEKTNNKLLNTCESTRSNYETETQNKQNRINYNFDYSYMQFHCDKSTQLPPVTYRNKSLLRAKSIPYSLSRPFYKEVL